MLPNANAPPTVATEAAGVVAAEFEHTFTLSPELQVLDHTCRVGGRLDVVRDSPFVGKKLLSFVHNDDLVELHASFQHVLVKPNDIQEVLYRRQRPSIAGTPVSGTIDAITTPAAVAPAKYYWFMGRIHSTVSPTTTADYNIAPQISLEETDVSEGFETLQDATAEHEKFRDLFENQSDVFYRLDGLGRFQLVSYACFNHWGYTPHELVGHSCWNMIIPNDYQNAQTQFQTCIIQQRPPRPFLVRRRCKNSSLVTEQVQLSPAKPLVAGKVAYVNVISRKVAICPDSSTTVIGGLFAAHLSSLLGAPAGLAAPFVQSSTATSHGALPVSATQLLSLTASSRNSPRDSKTTMPITVTTPRGMVDSHAQDEPFVGSALMQTVYTNMHLTTPRRAITAPIISGPLAPPSYHGVSHRPRGRRTANKFFSHPVPIAASPLPPSTPGFLPNPFSTERDQSTEPSHGHTRKRKKATMPALTGSTNVVSSGDANTHIDVPRPEADSIFLSVLGAEHHREASAVTHVPAAFAPPKRNSKESPEKMACVLCNTIRSLEWRKGPDGRKNMCNACGLRYARTLKRKGKADVKQLSAFNGTNGGSSDSS